MPLPFVSKLLVCKLLAILTLISLLADWRLVLFGVGAVQSGFWSGWLVFAFLLLGLAAALGLWRGAAIGFWSFYGYAALATFAFASAVIPYISSLFPGDLRSFAVIGINALMVLCAAFVHWQTTRQTKT